ncbi:hypothetical protein BGY98DRAFT_968977 [Russula aff. rugulosa BPL654]|nr:hypothetical protein BGY98DRAFT_968977 [Russula aff. rugulosa BPL654]
METSNVARVGSASFIIAAAFVFVLCAASLPKVDVFWFVVEKGTSGVSMDFEHELQVKSSVARTWKLEQGNCTGKEGG